MSAVERVLAVQNKLGEGPVWNADEQTLHWVDIEQGRVHRLHPATGTHDIFDLGLSVGALGFRADGGLVIATRDGFALWNPQTQALRVSSQYVGANPRGCPLGQVQDLPLPR